MSIIRNSGNYGDWVCERTNHRRTGGATGQRQRAMVITALLV
jgi:hypothetical protein